LQITQLTDYALRVLMYVGAHPDRRSTLREIAHAYGISLNHLRKVVHQLGAHGYLDTTRGRGGGLALAVAPERIQVAEVVSAFEPSMELVDCEREPCPLAGACTLKAALDDARDAFLERLADYTVADLLANRSTTVKITHLPDGLARSADQ
jgi:Rrf2 family nitric oxide-sensitive transcriptional repressor